VIGTARSDDDEHYEHILRLGRYLNRIFTVSSRIRDQIVSFDPSLAGKTVFIPNFIEECAAGPRAIDLDAPLKLFFAGRLVEKQKRISDLKKIADGLVEAGIPFLLRIAGSGPDEADLARSLSTHLARGTVEMLGHLAQATVEKHLRQHDVLLLTSDWEGMPNVVLEAMAHGCVPIATNIPSGIPDLVIHEETGFLVDVGAADQFVETLRRLDTDRALLAKTSAKALAHIRARFSADAVLPSYMAQIQEVWREITSGGYTRPYAPMRGPFPGISVPPHFIKSLR
jgi:glycosyltransferase involved in cell wall biosynthesis